MSQPSDDRKGFLGSKAGLTFLVLAGLGAFFLISEHRAHALGLLPYLLLLACPLMHLFMHGGHGHGRNDKRDLPSDEEPRAHSH
jgi:hypothetical protein